MSPGATWGPWKKWVLGWLILTAVVALATPLEGPSSALVLAGLAATLMGLRKVRKAIAAGSVERKQIGSLADYDGAVAVEGTARAAGETVTAPLTETESVAYRVKVSRASRSQDD